MKVYYFLALTIAVLLLSVLGIFLNNALIMIITYISAPVLTGVIICSSAD